MERDTCTSFVTKLYRLLGRKHIVIQDDLSRIIIILSISYCLQPHLTKFHGWFLIFPGYIRSCHYTTRCYQSVIRIFLWLPDGRSSGSVLSEDLTRLSERRWRFATGIDHHFTWTFWNRVWPKTVVEPERTRTDGTTLRITHDSGIMRRQPPCKYVGYGAVTIWRDFVFDRKQTKTGP